MLKQSVIKLFGTHYGKRLLSYFSKETRLCELCDNELSLIPN